MRATTYTREHRTRKLSRAKAKFYGNGTVFVVRCGKTWKTLGVVPFAEARAAAMQMELDIHKGLRAMLPAPAPKPASEKTADLMLDNAINAYLAEIKDGRKPKTHAAYSTALRYSYKCTRQQAGGERYPRRHARVRGVPARREASVVALVREQVRECAVLPQAPRAERREAENHEARPAPVRRRGTGNLRAVRAGPVLRRV